MAFRWALRYSISQWGISMAGDEEMQPRIIMSKVTIRVYTYYSPTFTPTFRFRARLHTHRQSIRKRIPPRHALKSRRRPLPSRLINRQLFPRTLHDPTSYMLESLSGPVQRCLCLCAAGLQRGEVGLGLAADGAEVGVDFSGSGDGSGGRVLADCKKR